MATTKAQQKAVNKYVKENYDRIGLIVPKGRKAQIEAYAHAQGESVNAFINKWIDLVMERGLYRATSIPDGETVTGHLRHLDDGSTIIVWAKTETINENESRIEVFHRQVDPNSIVMVEPFPDFVDKP